MDEFHANVRAAFVLHYTLVAIIVYLNNDTGVQCRASDSRRKSNDLWYLVRLTAQDTFQPR